MTRRCEISTGEQQYLPCENEDGHDRYSQENQAHSEYANANSVFRVVGMPIPDFPGRSGHSQAMQHRLQERSWLEGKTARYENTYLQHIL